MVLFVFHSLFTFRLTFSESLVHGLLSIFVCLCLSLSHCCSYHFVRSILAEDFSLVCSYTSRIVRSFVPLKRRSKSFNYFEHLHSDEPWITIPRVRACAILRLKSRKGESKGEGGGREGGGELLFTPVNFFLFRTAGMWVLMSQYGILMVIRSDCSYEIVRMLLLYYLFHTDVPFMADNSQDYYPSTIFASPSVILRRKFTTSFYSKCLRLFVAICLGVVWQILTPLFVHICIWKGISVEIQLWITTSIFLSRIL